MIKSIPKEVEVRDVGIETRDLKLEELDTIDEMLQGLAIEKPAQELVEAKYDFKIGRWMSKMNFVTGQRLGRNKGKPKAIRPGVSTW